HRQRPGPHPPRERPVLALDRGQRRTPLGQRRRIPLRPRRRDRGTRRLPDADPRTKIEGSSQCPRRSTRLRSRVLSFPPREDRWHPGPRDADRLVRPWLPHPWPVRKDGKEVGTLTALAMSPRLRKNIGYAWVPVRLSKLGTEFEIMTPAGPRKAIVVKKPFIDPKKDLPKSWFAAIHGLAGANSRIAKTLI